VRLFSARHEFPSEWARFKSAAVATKKYAELSITLKAEHYPFWSRGREFGVLRLDLFARTSKDGIKVSENAAGSDKDDVLVKDDSFGGLRSSKLTLASMPPAFGKLTLYLSDNSMDELWLALTWG
jgi:hypothetical protein